MTVPELWMIALLLKPLGLVVLLIGVWAISKLLWRVLPDSRIKRLLFQKI